MSAGVVDQHLMLVQAMGAKSYDPIPPEQFLCFLDEDFRISHPAQRLLALERAKTIHGRGKGVRRTAMVTDDKGRAVWLKDLARELDVALSNASSAQKELEENGLSRRDEKGRIWLCGDVLERRKNNTKLVGEEEANKRNIPLCTYNLPGTLDLYFQQVDSSLRAQYERDREVAREHRKRIEAEALAVAREAGEQLEKAVDNAWLKKVGLQPEPSPAKPKGRPKIERKKPTVQLSLLWVPDLSVHITPENGNGHSVQNGAPVLYKNENGSVQNAYIRKSDKSDKSEVSKSQAAEIQQAIQDTLGEKLPLTHPILTEFQRLAKKEGLPVRSVCRWIHAKVQEKIEQHYPIQGPKVLLQFAEKDLLPWAKQHPDEIQFDRHAVIERKHLSRSTPAERELTTQERIEELERWIEENAESGGIKNARKQLSELRGQLTQSAAGGLL